MLERVWSERWSINGLLGPPSWTNERGKTKTNCGTLRWLRLLRLWFKHLRPFHLLFKEPRNNKRHFVGHCDRQHSSSRSEYAPLALLVLNEANKRDLFSRVKTTIIACNDFTAPKYLLRQGKKKERPFVSANVTTIAKAQSWYTSLCHRK